MPSYREEVEAAIAKLVGDFLDAAEEHYGLLPEVVVFGIVAGLSYTHAGEEAGEDEVHSHDSVSFRFSEAKSWVQVGLLREALRLAESDE